MELTKERPAYVTFELIPQEDRAASIEQGRYVSKDVAFAIITPPGSTDRIPQLVEVWLQQLETAVREGRMPEQWAEGYRRKYEQWKKGGEVPVDGTPIRSWPLLSPAQVKNILAANVLTVEDLAAANGEALTRIGMGAQDLKTKAQKWLAEAAGAGKLVAENAALRAENGDLKARLGSLTADVERLQKLVPQAKPAAAAAK